MAAFPDVDLERGMPADVDAERSILGSILLNNEHYYEDAEDLRVEDFSLDAHRRIYAVMNEILFGGVEGATIADIITVVDALRKRKQLDSIGGVSYLASMMEGLPRRVSIGEWVRIVKEKSRLRSLVHLCNRTLTRVLDQQDSAATIAADLQDQVVAEDAEDGGEPVRIAEVIPEVREQVDKGRKIVEGKTAGLTWGLEKFDGITHGAHKGEMTVVVAKSGGFKTALAVQMVLANGRQKVPCCIHSIEMRKDKMTRRFYPAMGDFVRASHLRDPRLMNLDHMREMDKLSQELAGLPIWIDDKANDIRRVIARMRMMRRKYKIELFVIDYFQLLQNALTRTDIDRFQQNAYLLRDAMKSDDFQDSHLLVLSQFSKNKSRGKGQRSGDDLYGGLALQHAAQNVIIVSVESGKDKEAGQFLKAELEIDKMREGALVRHECQVDPDFLRFEYPEAYVKPDPWF